MRGLGRQRVEAKCNNMRYADGEGGEERWERREANYWILGTTAVGIGSERSNLVFPKVRDISVRREPVLLHNQVETPGSNQ